MLALWNGGEADPAEVYARGCTVDGGVTTFDPEEVVPEIAKYRSAFPDLRWTVDQWFAAGERYVLRMHASGTHTGEAASRIHTPIATASQDAPLQKVPQPHVAPRVFLRKHRRSSEES